MIKDPHVEAGILLMDLECVLRNMQLWSVVAPSDDALASTEPFCVDTLELHQWLQFIFMPRMQQLIVKGDRLPSACAIAPLAEEVYKTRLSAMEPLLQVLRQLDALLSKPVDR